MAHGFSIPSTLEGKITEFLALANHPRASTPRAVFPPPPSFHLPLCPNVAPSHVQPRPFSPDSHFFRCPVFFGHTQKESSFFKVILLILSHSHRLVLCVKVQLRLFPVNSSLSLSWLMRSMMLLLVFKSIVRLSTHVSALMGSH